jgi:glutathione S-transferase
MRILHHLPLSPFCRKVRVALGEKRLEFEMKVEKTWERTPAFLALNPAGTVPVLVDEDGTLVCHSQAICEHLEREYPAVPLIGETPAERAEVRRLVAWFDEKFAREVTDNLYREKLIKRFLTAAEPNSSAIRAGYQNIRYHLDYIGWLAERRKFLAGERYSLADIAAAAHISTLDYMGDVPWELYPRAHEWYARIKSRPAFRPLLADHLPGSPPPAHYADLDF